MNKLVTLLIALISITINAQSNALLRSVEGKIIECKKSRNDYTYIKIDSKSKTLLKQYSKSALSLSALEFSGTPINFKLNGHIGITILGGTAWQTDIYRSSDGNIKR
jgi:hypothetical protein